MELRPRPHVYTHTHTHTYIPYTLTVGQELLLKSGWSGCGHRLQWGNIFKRGLTAHLLRRDVKGDCPEVDLAIGVDARDDEEDARPLGAALAQPAQPEDHRPLVLLDNLKEGGPHQTSKV